jgi:hypothetical protein
MHTAPKPRSSGAHLRIFGETSVLYSFQKVCSGFDTDQIPVSGREGGPFWFCVTGSLFMTIKVAYYSNVDDDPKLRAGWVNAAAYAASSDTASRASSTSIVMAPSALGEPSLGAFEHLLGDERRGHRRRPTGVEREMGNDFAQFALFEPVVERALQVADQLLLAAERYQGGARDQAAVALGQAGTLPYLPEQHPFAEIDEGRDDVADLVTR